jgi:hypothetical protein
MRAPVLAAMRALINLENRTMAGDPLHGFHPIDVPCQRGAIGMLAGMCPP